MSVSRRTFLSTLSAASAGLVLPGPWALARSRDGFTPLRRGVGLFTGRGGTMGWLVSGDAVVVVDTQFPDSAGTFLTGLRERTDRRIDALVNTHHHGDHTAGNPVLAPHAERIVAHMNVPALQHSARREGAPEPVVASDTYRTEWSLALGDETLRLRHFGPAHTGGDSVVHFEKADVAHMGDLIFNRMPPFIDRPGGASIVGWIDVLERTHDTFGDDTRFIFGHAAEGYEVTGTRTDLLAMRDFLAGLLDYVQAGLVDGRTADDLASVDRLPAFPTYFQERRAGAIPACIRVAHAELTETN